MKRKHNTIALVLLLALLAVAGCGDGLPEADSPIVVSFKDKFLTQKQLDFYVPDGVSSEDSARFAKQFVSRWVLEQAVMDKAISEDESLEERIEYKVEDYRAKLIMHEYHTAIIEKSMSNEVADAEIKAYYEENKDNFRSKEALFSYFFLMTTVGENLNQVASWIRSSDAANLAKLRDWAEKNASEYKLDSSFLGETEINKVSKGYFGSLQKAGIGQLIQWNGVIQGVRRRYLFKMIDVVPSGDYLPISMCEDKIKGLLINEKKIKLIKETENKILQDAERDNLIKY